MYNIETESVRKELPLFHVIGGINVRAVTMTAPTCPTIRLDLADLGVGVSIARITVVSEEKYCSMARVNMKTQWFGLRPCVTSTTRK